MRIQPKSAQEIASDGLLPPGTYDFEIIKAEDTISKSSGNEMIALLLKVFDDAGKTKLVNDYLLESTAFKLRHACEAVGLLPSYEAGVLNGADFHGRTGRAKINITKDKSGQYPDKNGVQDYVPMGDVSGPAPRPRALAPVAADLDDEIPF